MLEPLWRSNCGLKVSKLPPVLHLTLRHRNPRLISSVAHKRQSPILDAAIIPVTRNRNLPPTRARTVECRNPIDQSCHRTFQPAPNAKSRASRASSLSLLALHLLPEDVPRVARPRGRPAITVRELNVDVRPRLVARHAERPAADSGRAPPHTLRRALPNAVPARLPPDLAQRAHERHRAVPPPRPEAQACEQEDHDRNDYRNRDGDHRGAVPLDGHEWWGKIVLDIPRPEAFAGRLGSSGPLARAVLVRCIHVYLDICVGEMC
ncbi:hypothetical protein B0T16DRAFT_201222 [Cercophora newfieldiana]|uniref:Uncharacterized protein n=1 Tax=Cercophora newfieldiana TaxID=92897 RepID=A0AA40CJ07_9PEZI|nr:hypothetical protein B0T16DRAFT_201222 [Cercophora newfieldiana]